MLSAIYICIYIYTLVYVVAKHRQIKTSVFGVAIPVISTFLFSHFIFYINTKCGIKVFIQHIYRKNVHGSPAQESVSIDFVIHKYKPLSTGKQRP